MVLNFAHREIQEDKRIRYWGQITELEEKFLRVVTLEDGETIHNAFPDRDFELPVTPTKEDL